MARKTRRAALELSAEQRRFLEKISHSRTHQLREIERAKILLLYSEKLSMSQISKKLSISRPTIYKCIDKALAAGIESGLKDKYHRPKEPVITEDAKAWVINLACTKPKDYGYATKVWSLSRLAEHTRNHAPASGYTCLNKAAKATIQRILSSNPIQPHKLKYYLERRDLILKKK